MITLTRGQVRRLRSVFRRSTLGIAHRGIVPELVLRDDGGQLRAQYRYGDLAVEYAKQRRQFGRPIGGFQAVKHLCADMAVRAEVARCAVQAAGVTADQPDVGDPDVAAAGAKLLADDDLFRQAATQSRAYAQGWLLVHYALKTKAVLPKFRDYLAAINARRDPKARVEDFGKHLGEPERVEAELRRYARRPVGA